VFRDDNYNFFDEFPVFKVIFSFSILSKEKTLKIDKANLERTQIIIDY